MDRKKVIVVGGGFAGLHFLRKLNNTVYDVMLIDKLNHHQFQPLFYQVATARLEPASISFPFRKLFHYSKNIEVRMGEVQEVDAANNVVKTSVGDFQYDILVIASGCDTNYYGNDKLASLALPMKNTIEAIAIRNKILMHLEKVMSAQTDEKGAFEDIVIVGAGATGVELAGSFAEMKKNVLPKDYPQVDFSGMKVYLVGANKVILPNMSESSQKASYKYLRELGVELLTDTQVSNYDGTTIFLENGNTLKSKNVIWTAGVKGNVIKGLNLEIVEHSRYKVDRFSKIQGYENIYALGDVALMRTEKYPDGHPQVANVAINQAKNLAKNLLSKKGFVNVYTYTNLGSMATIGKYKAVVDLPFVRMRGRYAWYIWMFLHLMLILSVRNKIIVFINWMWSFFTKDSSLRLIMTKEVEK